MVDANVNYLMDIQEKYEMVEQLLSTKDPHTEPYKSKYAAAVMLKLIRTEVSELIDNIGDEESCERLSAMLAATWLRLGVISYETEDLSTGKVELGTAIEVTNAKPLHPRFIIVRISALNHLGVLYSYLEEAEKSKRYLEESERLYKEFTDQDEPKEAIRVEDLFKANASDATSPRSKAESDLEKSHTLTLYYLAQIYGSLKDHLRSAVYCHNTLKRQLESKDYDPIEWSLNAATLSQFFMERCGFKQARHHLAAASYVLDKYYDEHIKNIEGSTEEDEAKKERYKHRSADVARCWAKYGLLLLESSKERLMKRADENDDNDESPTTDLAKQVTSDETQTSKDDLSSLHFSTLEIPTYENQIVDKFVLDYEDALPVFHSTKQWLEDAKSYYTLEEHASDFVRVTQDCSALFQVLAFFESDENRQCRMHKRRVDMLEQVVSSLNHQCYLQLCRQIWYELGETYFEMLHLKLGKLRDDNSEVVPDPRALNKLNSLTQKSIDNFGHFLSSAYSDGSSIKDIKLEPALIHPVLSCHFFRGRLFARIITCDAAQKLENHRKSLASFKFIVDFCSEHPDAEKHVALELPVCKEMVELLPHKIRQLLAQAAQMNQ